MRPVADDLAGLVALAGDAEHVAGLEHGDGAGDRLAAVADLDRVGRGGEDRLADRGRVLGARIVVGDDDHVGVVGGGLAHQRPLAGIAVAAGAEDDDQPAARSSGAAPASALTSASGLWA